MIVEPMIVEIAADAGRLRQWMVNLADRIAAGGAEVRFRLLEDGPPAPAGFGLVLELERMVLRRGRAPGLDVIQPPDLAYPREGGGPAAGLVIDLTETGVEDGGARVLRPLYGSHPGEDAMLAVALSDAEPVVEIVDAASGRVLERGRASLEMANGIAGIMDALAARAVTLLTALAAAGPRVATPVAAAAPGTARALPLVASRNLAAALAKSLYRMCFHAPHWRVGWRRNPGPGVWETQSLAGPTWRILPDPGNRFFADPFPIIRDGRSFVFVEDLDHSVGKGIISVVELGETGPIGEVTPVIEEPWHLSYPFLFPYAGEVYMIPESSATNAVHLYRAAQFPHRWERVATLLEGISVSDATIVQHEGRWWLFAATSDGAGGPSDTLSLFHAAHPFGPYQPHAANPIFVDATAARPAGAMIRRQGTLWRPVQDCGKGYGAVLGLAEVVRLDVEGYEQRVRTKLSPGPLWPGRKLHTLNRAGAIEVIDGTTYRPKIAAVARAVDRRMLPQGADAFVADIA
jgi:hypothetical protein